MEKKGPIRGARPRPPGPTGTVAAHRHLSNLLERDTDGRYQLERHLHETREALCRPPRNCFSTKSMTSDGPECLGCDGSGQPRSAR